MKPEYERPEHEQTNTDRAATDHHFLLRAIKLSRDCPKVEGSFAVGAVITSGDGTVLATGRSLETGPKKHAEEVAIERAIAEGIDLTGTTIYSSLEPCSVRLSGRPPCCEHIINAGITRVVFALPEPPVFVTCEGQSTLEDHGLTVTVHKDLAEAVREVNGHLM